MERTILINKQSAQILKGGGYFTDAYSPPVLQ